MNRGKKILLAIYLALGFLLLRLCYAFLFNGLVGETVILDLAEVSLPRPLSHIQLLGAVSLEGIIRNLEIGVPFALSILGFGILASFISQAALLRAAENLPWLRNLLTAIALGLAVIPAVFEAARKVRYALWLRGETRRQLLIPMLERAVEIANSLGLRIALSSKPEPRSAGIEIQGLKLQGLDLKAVTLSVKPGEICVLSGPTGVGKTSVLEAVVGVASEYRGRQFDGENYVAGLGPSASMAKLSQTVGFVSQNPRELIAGLSISDLGQELRSRLLLDWELELSGKRELESLSEGEIFKVVFSQTLMRNPSVLVLDEPFDSLDSNSRVNLAKKLENYAALGNSVLISEHEPLKLDMAGSRRVQLSEEGVLPGTFLPKSPSLIRALPLVGSEQVLELSIPEIRFSKLLLGPSEVALNQGECVWLRGDNGAGKTTLLKRIVELSGQTKKARKASDKRRVVLVPEHFDDFFVTDSLGAELHRADRISGVAPGFTLKNLESILPARSIANQLDVHPRDLSRGTRLALAIAMQLSHKPTVLLIDEPFRGLDPGAKELVSETIRCVQETGCAVLFASHDATWARALKTRILEISAQELNEVVEVTA